MNVDTLARRMSEATRDQVNRAVDIEANLHDLGVTRMRRRRSKAVAALVAATAAVAVAAAVLPRDTVEDSPPVAASDRSAVTDGRCPDHSAVRCLDSTVLVRSKTPYTFRLHRGFSHAMGVEAAPYSLDIFRTGGHQGGLTILEGVQAAGNPKVRGAERLARWVASREFLQASSVQHGISRGLDTWTVRVSSDPGRSAEWADPCNGVQRACRAVLAQPSRSGWETGVWDGMRSRYTFLDVPGLGTVALWSWTFGEEAGFKSDDVLVRSINFHVPS